MSNVINNSSLAHIIKPSVAGHYTLLEKHDKVPMEQFSQKQWGLGVGSNAKYYSYVKVGRDDNPEFNREILTLYDDKKIMARYRIGNDVNYQRRIYDDSYVSDGDKLAKRRHILTKEWDDSKGSWFNMKEEEQFIHNVNGGVKLHQNQNIYDYSGDKIKILKFKMIGGSYMRIFCYKKKV